MRRLLTSSNDNKPADPILVALMIERALEQTDREIEIEDAEEARLGRLRRQRTRPRDRL